MITANGKNIIKRFHAQQVGQIGGSLAFGVGTVAATVNDTGLNYEVIRIPLASVNVDPNSDRIVFRGILPAGGAYKVYEVGLWSGLPGAGSGRFLNLLGFSPATWTNGTLTNTNARANRNVLQVNYVANGTTNAELVGFFDDLSNFNDVDTIVVGYHATTNLSSVRVRLGSDSANYFEFVLPAPVANSYNIARLLRSSATKTGNPTWSNLGYAAIRPSATAAGSGSIFFDGIRIESNPVTENNLLVARAVLGTPQTVDADIPSDVEYALRITTA